MEYSVIQVVHLVSVVFRLAWMHPTEIVCVFMAIWLYTMTENEETVFRPCMAGLGWIGLLGIAMAPYVAVTMLVFALFLIFMALLFIGLCVLIDRHQKEETARLIGNQTTA